jgi:hypothetical protein
VRTADDHIKGQIFGGQEMVRYRHGVDHGRIDEELPYVEPESNDLPRLEGLTATESSTR